MNSYTEGQVIQFTGTFTDAAGTAIDPTTVEFKYRNADNGPTTTLTYAGATQPAVGEIAKTATGVYVALVDTTGLAGRWTVEWQSTGVGQAVTLATGLVNSVPF